MNLVKVFAERLKELREDAGLSLTALAEKLGVSAVAISRWERQVRIPNIENLVQIARYFRVSTDYLCGLED